MDKIQIPKTPAEFVKDVPAPALASTHPWPWCGVSESQARECKQGYYATISFVDAQIGRVLEAVDRFQLWDNTIVVFWSDHGYHLGEHGLWHKQSLFENSAHVPLVIVAPGAKSKGQTCPRTVEFVDLYPTLADLAGLKAPKNLAGKSLRPLLDEPTAKWNKAAFTQVWRSAFLGHSVRTERYRYIEWDDGKEGVQLYDYETDPTEQHNLANDPKHVATVTELKSLVRQNWSKAYRPGTAEMPKATGKKKDGKKSA
jgi:uncharacterized sulfatase